MGDTVKSMPAVVALLRPLQWTKNLLVFAALLFARQYGEAGQAERALAAFVAFCLASSALYALNDVLDRDADRRHPRKRLRPVASGAVGTGTAIAVAVAAALGAFAAAWTLDRQAHDALYFRTKEMFKGQGKTIVRIGDCLAPRDTLKAIHDAYGVTDRLRR